MEEKQELVKTTPNEKKKYSMDTPIDELEKQLLFETDPNNMQEIVDIFNLNIKKKNIIRALKSSELQDKVLNQMGLRIDKRADDFSNKDLLDYFKTIQATIDTSDNTIDVDPTVIQIIDESVRVGIGNDALTRDEQMKVLDVVKSIISDIEQDEISLPNDDAIDGEFTEVQEEKENIDAEQQREGRTDN